MSRPWLIAAASTLAFALLLTFPGFLPGRVLLPLDHPRDLAAWKPDPQSRFEISNKIVSDPIYEYLAWDTEIRRLLRTGQMPWRSRWAGDGAHLYANPETALFFPFTWPRLLLGDKGWVFTALLKLWAGALGMWWLARTFGAAFGHALIAGFVYAGSGYMTVWLLFPHTNVYATLPWLAAAVVLFSRAPSPRSAVAIVAAAGLATAGGHPETLFHAVIALAIFVLLTTSAKRGGAIAALAFAGFAMVAIQLVPFAVALAKSDIVQTRGAADHPRVRLFAAAAQFLPGFLGSPLRGELDLSGIAQPEAENFNERNAGYAGAITLLAIALAWRRLSRELRIGLLIGAGALIIGWKLPLIEDLIRMLPLFGIAANERFPLVFVFFAAMALPAGLAALATDNPRRRLGVAIAIVALAMALTAALPAIPAGRDLVTRAARSGIAHMQRRDFLRKPAGYYDERLQHYLEGLKTVSLRRVAAPMFLIAIAGIALARKDGRRDLIIGGAVVAEIILFSWGYSPAVPRGEGAQIPAAIADVKRLDPSGLHLIAASQHVYDANLGTIHGVRDVRSYDVLQEHARIERLASMDFDRVSRGFPSQLSAAAVQALPGEGVRYFLSRQPPPGTRLVGGSPSPAVGVYELPNAVAIASPANRPPAGFGAGAAISALAMLGAVVLVRRLPYHRL